MLTALVCTRGEASGAATRENASKLTECGMLSCATVVVSVPLIQLHVLPALADAPYGARVLYEGGSFLLIDDDGMRCDACAQ